jgi:5S rRNA maturation endonuclease (ribonuclease M5)
LDDILIVVEGINDMRAVKRAIDVDVRFDCQLL